eukprot:scaffold53421_cov19-Tisochrysis_lutea.AAC.2
MLAASTQSKLPTHSCRDAQVLRMNPSCIIPGPSIILDQGSDKRKLQHPWLPSPWQCVEYEAVTHFKGDICYFRTTRTGLISGTQVLFKTGSSQNRMHATSTFEASWQTYPKSIRRMAVDVAECSSMACCMRSYQTFPWSGRQVLQPRSASGCQVSGFKILLGSLVQGLVGPQRPHLVD